MAMIIMVAEANNDGSNIKWSFVVVFEGGCCFIFGCFLGDISVGGLFLLAMSYFYLLLYLYYYLLPFSLCVHI